MRNLIVLIFCFFTLNGFGQNHLKVLDQETNLPVVGAKITCQIAGETLRYLSNEDGNTRIPKKNDFDYKINISHVAYDTLSLKYSDLISRNDTFRCFLSPIQMFEHVVITAQYKPIVTHNAIQKISVIPIEQIEQSGAINLAEILTYQTGIRLSQDNILGSSISLGGLSGQNVKILIDGIAIIGRQDGNLDLSQINLDNIERIEIIEGPLSVNYGTNALAGTINLITKKKSQKSIDLSINPFYESIGNYNLTGSLSTRIKKHHFIFTGGRNFFDGWSRSDDFISIPKSELADSNRFKTWKPKEQYFFEFRYATKFNEWELSPYVRYFDEIILNRGAPIAPYNEIGLDDYYQTLRQDVGTSIQKKFKKSNFNSTLAFNRFIRNKNTYIKDLTSLSSNLSKSLGAQDTSKFNLLNFRANYIYSYSKKFTLEAGLDFVHENAYGQRIEGLKKNQGDYAIYSTLEWKIHQVFTIKPGLRYAYNTAYSSPLTPSINMLSKWKSFRFRAAVASGFRSPSLKELHFNFVDINHNINGNAFLKAEKSMNYSGSISLEKKIANKYKINYDYSFFYNDVNNLITLGLAEDGNYTYINVGTFKSLGNQFNINLVSSKTNASMSLGYIGRYNKLSEIYQGINEFTFSPEFSLTLSYKCFKDIFRVNTFFKFNGLLQSYAVSAAEQISVNAQSAYSILDLSVSTAIFKKKLALILGLKNLLDVTEVDVIGTALGGAHQGTGNLNAARGRSVFISLKYNFSYDFKKN